MFFFRGYLNQGPNIGRTADITEVRIILKIIGHGQLEVGKHTLRFLKWGTRCIIEMRQSAICSKDMHEELIFPPDQATRIPHWPVLSLPIAVIPIVLRSVP